MSRADPNRNVPRAMIHRRILDVAETNPEASLEAIADEVSGASPPLVERVLDEYGDPAETGGPESPTGDETDGLSPAKTDVDGEVTDEATADEATADEETADEETADDGDTTVDDETTDNGESTDVETTDDETAADAVESESDDHNEETMPANGQQSTNGSTGTTDPEITLSDKQHRTLRVVYDNPDASQGDIAEALGVTRPTVSRRLNSIPGFDWSDRRSFADSVFGDETRVNGDVADAHDPEPEHVQAEASATAELMAAAESARRPEKVDQAELESESDDRTGSADEEAGTGDGRPDVSEIHETLDALDRRLSAVESADTAEAAAGTSDDGGSTATDAAPSPSDTATVELSPDLAHKVLRACLESERVTEDEERDLLRSLVGN